MRVNHLAQLRVGCIQDGRPVTEFFRARSAGASNTPPPVCFPTEILQMKHLVALVAWPQSLKITPNATAIRLQSNEKRNMCRMQSRFTFVHFGVAGLPEVDVAERTYAGGKSTEFSFAKSARRAAAYLHWCSIDPNLRADCWAAPEMGQIDTGKQLIG